MICPQMGWKRKWLSGGRKDPASLCLSCTEEKRGGDERRIQVQKKGIVSERERESVSH